MKRKSMQVVIEKVVENHEKTDEFEKSIAMTVEEAIDLCGSAYVIAWPNDGGDWYTEELTASDAWLGGKSGGWATATGLYFDTIEGYEADLQRNCATFLVFDSDGGLDEYTRTLAPA